ncbi:MAG: hypothetical protein ACRDRI_20195 [Pseudonocardiaceae bacterium]
MSDRATVIRADYQLDEVLLLSLLADGPGLDAATTTREWRCDL